MDRSKRDTLGEVCVKMSECEHSWYKKDRWEYWKCEKCGAIQTTKEHREEHKRQLIELNKKFREWGYEGKPITRLW